MKYDQIFMMMTMMMILQTIVRFLISSLLFQHGETALHLACRYGHLGTVRTLVELGADKEANDEVKNLMMMMSIEVTITKRCLFLTIRMIVVDDDER